ncbi:MAG: hypothetical protein LBF61_11260 [Azoarcus sp.]|jgi:hypothetical protein|nr:hypothetical protein [Azoarcus sp.]
MPLPHRCGGFLRAIARGAAAPVDAGQPILQGREEKTDIVMTRFPAPPRAMLSSNRLSG